MPKTWLLSVVPTWPTVNSLIFAIKQWKRRPPPLSLLLSLFRSPTQIGTGTNQPVHCLGRHLTRASIHSAESVSHAGPSLSCSLAVSLSLVLVTGVPSPSPWGRGRIIFHLNPTVSLRTSNPLALTHSSPQSSALQTGGPGTVACGWVSSADSSCALRELSGPLLAAVFRMQALHDFTCGVFCSWCQAWESLLSVCCTAVFELDESAQAHRGMRGRKLNPRWLCQWGSVLCHLT